MNAIRACVLPVLVALAMAADAPGRTVRVATYNVSNGVSSVDSAKYAAISSVLARVDADIVGFQELNTASLSNWVTLAGSLGYPHTAVSGTTGLSGGLRNGYFSKFPILSTFNVYSPAGANEISRPPFRAVVEVPGAVQPLLLWNLHHKALSGGNNEFRRAVESIRCAQDIGAYLAANPQHSEFVVLGDMNADASWSQTTAFHSLPSGLPASYSLGADILFPVYYAVFPLDAYEPAGSGMLMLDAFHQNSSARNTFIYSGGRLDYLFVSSNLWTSPLGPPATEVYNSAADHGAGGLAKPGSPLAASVSATASDHYLVFMDVQMQPVSEPGELFEDGESGGSGWIANGLWSLVHESHPCGRVKNGQYAWRYGSATDCSYDVGSNQGTLTSPPFLVPPLAFLSFWSWEQTEADGTEWDQRRVQLSLNNGATWLDVYQSNVSPAEWRFLIVDLSAYAGQTARLRFLFDTVDGMDNAQEGWFLDDIRVSAAGRLEALAEDLVVSGVEGGPFAPNPLALVLTNRNEGRVAWRLAESPEWLNTPDSEGLLEASESVVLNLDANGAAAELAGGLYGGALRFTNALDVLNAVTVNVELLVRDELPDAWRLTHFGHIEPDAADLSRARDDADGDGMTNYEEFLADTDPRNASSVLRAPILEWENGSIRLRFPTSAARLYTLEYSDALLDSGAWWVAADFEAVPGSGAEMHYLDSGTGTQPAPADSPHRTYRLRVGPP